MSCHKRIIQIDTRNAGGDQLGRLFPANRVHRRTANLGFFTGKFRSPVNRITIGIQKTSFQIGTDLHSRRVSQKYNLCVGRNPFCPRKNLQRDLIAQDLYHLGQFVIHDSQLIITYMLSCK